MELVARVRALGGARKAHRSRIVEVSDLVMDIYRPPRNSRGPRRGPDAPRDALLETLALAEGRVLTREVLQETVWVDEEVYPNTVDVCIGHLRRKMDQGHSAKLIRTVHGVGYRLEAPDQSENL